MFLKKTTKTVPILLYHRIQNVNSDPLMLCVSPETFEEHLMFLKKNYDVISLYTLSERIKNKNIIGNEAAITFDDGYKDNINNALPLLEKYNIPATIFVVTGFIGEKASFEWDMEYKEEDRAFFLNKEEIIKLNNHPLIEIGAHTHIHPRLSDLNYEEQKKEILESKKNLEIITEDRIRMFAYPFGGRFDFNKISEKAVSEINFNSAFSNNGSLVSISSKMLSIPRINIRECTIEELSKKIWTKN